MKFKALFNAGLTMVALSAPAAWGAGVDLRGTMFETIGLKRSVDPLLLYSVALTESALAAGKGTIAPYPYVIRSAEGPKFFDKYSEAKVELDRVLAKSKNVDIGMMQVNAHHHPGVSPADLLHPLKNLDYAATYLKATMASTSDPVIGVGRYHSYTNELAQWYGNRVWTIYNNIKAMGN